MPSAPAARKLAWADAVAAALDVLRDCMHDPTTRLRAAEQVMAVELTRMRHGRAVAGTDTPPADDDLPRGRLGLPPDIEAWELGDGEPPDADPPPETARVAVDGHRRRVSQPPPSATPQLGPPPMATDPAGRPRHLWQLPTFAAGLTAAVASLAAFPPPPPDPSAAFTKAVAELAKAVEKKPAAVADAERLAPVVAEQADRFPELQAKAHLLLGTADVLLAEANPDPAHWAAAADHFAQCDPAKLDDADARKLLYRSAKCDAALTKGDPADLLAKLLAPPAGEEVEGERLRLLGDCYLRLPTPDRKKAAAAFDGYLRGTVKLPAPEAARYKLLLAEAFQATGEPDKGKPWLLDVAKNGPPESQARAKFLLGGLAAAEGDWAEAVTRYEEAVLGGGLPKEQFAHAQYQMGVGLTRTQRPTLAVPAFEKAAEAGGPGAVAARVRLAELAVADPATKGRRGPAVDRLEAVAQSLAAAFGELPPAVTRPQVEAVFEECIQLARNEGDFPSAVRACTAAAAVLPAGRDRLRRAEVLVDWANALGLGPDAAGKRKEAAADLAALAGDPNRADRGPLLRQAADLLRKAGDAAAAVALTDQLVAAPGVPPDVAADAWLDKGESLLAGGKFADAADALKKAMAGSGPAAGVARVKLGLAHLQQARAAARTVPPGSPAAADAASQFDLGLTLLTQAAAATADTPATRDAHQQALFELGKVLLSRQNVAEAETRFRQLVQAYPGGPQSGPGQLYLGSCLLLLARGDATGRPPADADGKLAEAVKLFDALANGSDDYLRREGGIRLVNAVLLQQKYDEVPGLCDRLAGPYRGKVQELIFLSMAYKAHEFAKRPEQQARVRVQMEEVFGRLGEADFPGGSAEYTRDYWVTQWFEPLRRATRTAIPAGRSS